MTPTPSLNWTLPIYTVPDERNPVPVRCEVDMRMPSGAYMVSVAGGLPVPFEFAFNGRVDTWFWSDAGEPVGGPCEYIPRLQNLPEETA